MATAPVCLDDPAPPTWAECVSVQLVEASEPFALSPEVLAECGQAFAAGFFIVTAFWGFGYAASYVLDGIKRA